MRRRAVRDDAGTADRRVCRPARMSRCRANGDGHHRARHVAVHGSNRRHAKPPERGQAGGTAFVEGRLPATFNVGLVSFSGQANIVGPPTTDRAQWSLTRSIGFSSGRPPRSEKASTPSLDAVRSLDVQAIEDPPPARIVLLSDGANTAGRPLDEASAAAVVSRRSGGHDRVRDAVGGDPVREPVDPRPGRRGGAATGRRCHGGTFAEAATGEELEQVYTDLGSSIGYRTEQREITVMVHRTRSPASDGRRGRLADLVLPTSLTPAPAAKARRR